MIHLRELTPDDAPAIARLEAQLHPATLIDGAENHRRYLTEAAAAGVNLSFGAFDDDRLVGYLLCYGFEPTGFPDEHGHVLYIEDVAVLPEFRSVLLRLLKRLCQEAVTCFPGVAVESHSVSHTFQLWLRHQAALCRAGLRLLRYRETGETIAGKPRYLTRWELLPMIETTPDMLDELLQKLSGESLDVDGRRFEVKLLQDARRWPALASRWDELLLATPEHTVFQRYAYQRLWWRHFGGDHQLYIVLILEGGVVQGIAPLQVQTVKYHGRYCRRLAFIGSRWEVDRPTFLFPRDGTTLRRVLVRFLARRAADWDFCDFHEQRTGTEALAVLREAFREAGYLVAATRDSDCPYLVLEGDWKGFLAGKSQTFRKNIKAAGRRLRAFGEVASTVYEKLPDVLEQLDVYRTIEARSWKHAEGVGISRNEAYFAFYRDLAETFGRQGAFTIRMLTVNGQPIAGTFGVADDGVYYSLQIVHDQAFSRCSPGTYLEALEMEECFGRGYREYEFLGGFLNNKSRWTSTVRRTTQLHVFRRTPFFVGVYLLLFRIKPWVKERIRPYMRSWRQDAPAETADGD